MKKSKVHIPSECDVSIVSRCINEILNYTEYKLFTII